MFRMGARDWKPSDWLALGYFAGVFALTMLCGWLLSLAYPEGMTNAETVTYWGIHKKFAWFAKNGGDWLRTIPFGFVLAASTRFSNPTIAIYWLNTVIFSLNSALVFVLGRAIFASSLYGLLLAITAVFFEFASMRMFFTHLHATADPFYGEVVYLGILLALIAWLRCSWLVFLLGYAVLGLAAFVKPQGVSLFPVWIGFSIWSWLAQPGREPKRYGIILASIILLTGPVALWTARNYCLYGQPKYMGVGGVGLMFRALPLLTDSDRVFDDKAKNAGFIAAVRECERKKFFSQSWDNFPAWVVAMKRYEGYFFFIEGVNGPFEYLSNLRRPKSVEHPAYLDTDKLFDIDRTSTRIALRIIRAHPLAFLREVASAYYILFNPPDLPPAYWECYQDDPKIAYKTCADWGINIDKRLYPGRESPDAKLSNPTVARMIGFFCKAPPIQGMLNLYYSNQIWLSHLIFFACVVWLAKAAMDRTFSDRSPGVSRMMVALIMLFLSAASHYLVISITQVARLRYAMSGGELQLHLMFLIALFAVMRYLLGIARVLPCSSNSKPGYQKSG